MNDDTSPAAATPDQDFAWDPEAERLHQIRIGLAMTPAERLRWLETTVAELRPWLGLARTGARSRSGTR